MSWARDSTRIPMRQPQCSILEGLLHAKLIPLVSKTRYAERHVNCIALGCKLACAPPAVDPATGGVACGVRQRSESEPVAGDRLCRRACGAVDLHPDQSEGGARHPYGCRGSFRLGSEVPARLRQHPPLAGWGAGL